MITSLLHGKRKYFFERKFFVNQLKVQVRIHIINQVIKVKKEVNALFMMLEQCLINVFVALRNFDTILSRRLSSWTRKCVSDVS